MRGHFILFTLYITKFYLVAVIMDSAWKQVKAIDIWRIWKRRG